MKYLIIKQGLPLRDYKRFTVPLYRPSRNKVKELARQLLLRLEYLLTKTGLNALEVEKRLDTLREEAIGGLRGHIGSLEVQLGIEKEVKVERIKRSKPSKPKKDRKKSKKNRGGFFI